MASTTDMNIVLGQGSAVKEAQNVRRQNLELNQQFVAQQTEKKNKEDRTKVQEFETAKKIGIEEDEERKKKKGSGQDGKGSKKGQSEEASNLSEGSLIDVRV
ncbi:MAG: hypothetical protein JRJ77_08790 [Deltaproteobacteria bacterium]|nr:hypothetical protein [Deltaproteobacteria bacterium]MBW2338793.1 hypothetical protein [Deltaproteobacteria bacterium]